MRHLLMFFALFSCASLQAYEAAPATIVTATAPINDIYVYSENLDELEFVIGDPRSGARSVKKRGQYKYVDYGDPKDDAYKIAEAYLKKGEPARAVDNYRKAISSATYQWVIEKSYLTAAECLSTTKLNKPEDSIVLIDELLKKFPKTIHLGTATALRADQRLAKGDLAGAEKDYRAIEQNAAAWGIAPSRGFLGQAEVLRKAGKFAEAAQLLRPVLNNAKDPEAAARLGLGLADMLCAANQKDEALKVLRPVAFSSADISLRADGHLRIARILADGASGVTLLQAFDHAVLAASLGADDTIDSAARTLGRELAAKIEKDKTFSDEERQEYKLYGRSL